MPLRREVTATDEVPATHPEGLGLDDVGLLQVGIATIDDAHLIVNLLGKVADELYKAVGDASELLHESLIIV